MSDQWPIDEPIPPQLFDEFSQAEIYERKQLSIVPAQPHLQWWELLTKAEWMYQRYDGFTPGEGLCPTVKPLGTTADYGHPARNERHAAIVA